MQGSATLLGKILQLFMKNGSHEEKAMPGQQKQPLGIVQLKSCSEVCFCLDIWGVLSSITLTALLWRHIGKSSCSVKNMLFCLGYWGVLNSNPGVKLRALLQNWVFWWRFPYFPAILRCSFVVIACFFYP